jgi:flagellar hook-associated protein 1
MSLTSSLNIGHSALTASQLAIQVTGNNLANVATPGYSRQLAIMSPQRGSTLGGPNAGRGVRVLDVQRQVDDALQARLWTSVSRQSAASSELQIISQVESTLNELTGFDVSTAMSEFFSIWSEGGNLTQVGPTIAQQGEALAGHLRQVRRELVDQRRQVDDQLAAAVRQADASLNEIARLNKEIVAAEAGGGTAGALRDQRAILVTELSAFADVNTVEQASGTLDVFVGSTPIVLGGRSRGLAMARTSEGNEIKVAVRVRADGTELPIEAGSIGALLASRDGAVDGTIEKLDDLAAQLVFRVNRLHATGRNEEGFSSLTSTLAVSPGDRSLALNDPNNASIADLPFGPTNGGFLLSVTNKTTGSTEIVRIDVDLDGIDASGNVGFSDDTSLEDIAASLGAVSGINASIAPNGQLNITASAGHTFSFSEDSSDVLATLGVNSFFSGSTAGDIAVRGDLLTDPTGVTLGRDEGGVFVANATALAIAGVQSEALTAFGGVSVDDFWAGTVSDLGVKAGTAKTNADATQIVQESLQAQRDATSGVSVDEESINLINYQRAYQGAARFISIIDELTNTLISLV